MKQTKFLLIKNNICKHVANEFSDGSFTSAVMMGLPSMSMTTSLWAAVIIATAEFMENDQIHILCM